MAYMRYYDFENDAFPGKDAPKEEMDAWLKRAEDLHQAFCAKVAGLLVYTADVLSNETCPHTDGEQCEFCVERWAEWAALLKALPEPTRQAVLVTLKVLGTEVRLA